MTPEANLLNAKIDYQITETSFGVWKRYLYSSGQLYQEFRSHTSVAGWPLVHVVRGRSPTTGRVATAKGIIAIGQKAVGALAIGQAAVGVVAIGQLAVGILIGIGQAATGIFALGQAALGVFCVGQFVIGVWGIAQMGIGGHHLHTASPRWRWP